MNTPGSTAKQPMSESLKARLKKCGRSYHSPVIARSHTHSPDGTTSQNTTTNSSIQVKSTSTPHAKICSSFKSPSLLKGNSAFKSPAESKSSSSSCSFKSPALSSRKKHFETPTNIGKQIVVNNTLKSSEDSTRRTLVEEFNHAGTSRNMKNSPCATDDSLTKSAYQERHESCKGVKRKRDSGELDSGSGTECNDLALLVTTDGKTPGELEEMKNRLLKMKAKKEEKLRILKMMKLQQSKNNVPELRSLTAKWQWVVQMALPRLRELAREPRPSLTQLIDHLQLDHDRIGYSAEDESFS